MSLIICPKDKCMWEAGSAKTAAATAVRSRRPDRVPTLHSFFRFPPRERTRSGDAPADMSGGCLVSRSRNPGTYVDET